MGEIFKYKVVETEIFAKWFASLKDEKTKARIDKRIYRMRHGNFGDTKALNNEVFELRIKFGPGYRIYYTQRERTIVILLCAGDKSTQSKDIKKAKKMASEV